MVICDKCGCGLSPRSCMLVCAVAEYGDAGDKPQDLGRLDLCASCWNGFTAQVKAVVDGHKAARRAVKPRSGIGGMIDQIGTGGRGAAADVVYREIPGATLEALGLDPTGK